MLRLESKNFQDYPLPIFNKIIYFFQIVLFLAFFALLVNGTPISHSTTTEPNKVEIEEQSSRQGKTLGILTVAGSALSIFTLTVNYVLHKIKSDHT